MRNIRDAFFNKALSPSERSFLMRNIRDAFFNKALSPLMLFLTLAVVSSGHKLYEYG